MESVFVLSLFWCDLEAWNLCWERAFQWSRNQLVTEMIFIDSWFFDEGEEVCVVLIIFNWTISDKFSLDMLLNIIWAIKTV